MQADLILPSPSRPYRYIVNFSEIDNDSANPTRLPTATSSRSSARC